MAATADIYAIIARYRAELAAKERDRTRDLTQAYAEVARALQATIDASQEALARAEEDGRSTLSAAFQRALAERLEDEALRRLKALNRRLYNRILKERQEAVETGARLAAELRDEILGAGGIFDPRAVGIRRGPLEAILGILDDDSPLQRLLLDIAGTNRGNLLAQAGAEAVRQALIRSVALSLSPRRMAAAIRRALGTNFTRALTIARTEQLRAVRAAATQSYADVDAFTGWVWISARDERTCAACWAMHGRFFPFEEAVDAVVGSEPPAPGDPRPAQESGTEPPPSPPPPPAPLIPDPNTVTEADLNAIAEDPLYAAEFERYDRELKEDEAQDRLLLAIQKRLGTDGLPTVVDELDPDADQFWRGLTSRRFGIVGRRHNPEAIEDARAYADQFRFGDLYPGTGMYGSGAYAAIGKDGFTTAHAYGSVVLSGAIPRTAKRIVAIELREELRALAARLDPNKMTRAANYLLYDLGRYAALRGYDVVVSNDPGGEPNTITILNRSIAQILTRDATLAWIREHFPEYLEAGEVTA